ncbi:OmpA family protein [Sphingomonas montanisoli]|uniref:OmpA family protein n=1 Tax=Sphingomonas montanisoli TaxID=2606412 RepID=A0A5D9BZY6_9SPHN|nr:OmpA family protein [Sphingomonas montanisoli]TZG25208.1 OmpA family protein [Sphingomonas montanisoli]
MRVIANRPSLYAVLAIVALPIAGSLSAQQQDAVDPSILVNGVPAADPVTLTKGPEIKGVISARQGDKLKVTTADGNSTVVAINQATKIKGKRSSDSLLNGLPVTVKTMQGGPDLLASQINFQTKDLKTATMIRNATERRFVEQAAATEALRGRVGDIDKYNIKHTTNVHFDTGKSNLSAEDKEQLCSTATQANATENALLLVIGYTDSTGSEDTNQALSEKRASRVINYLQQACGWKPYRMLTPTGMATADPLASNDTEEGKAQNRRVAVNVMVSKSVDNM